MRPRGGGGRGHLKSGTMHTKNKKKKERKKKKRRNDDDKLLLKCRETRSTVADMAEPRRRHKTGRCYCFLLAPEAVAPEHLRCCLMPKRNISSRRRRPDRRTSPSSVSGGNLQPRGCLFSRREPGFCCCLYGGDRGGSQSAPETRL